MIIRAEIQNGFGNSNPTAIHRPGATVTTTSVERAIRRVIDDMHVNLSQEITIDDMARTAMFSKFHFTRIFREVTGTSPGRFLSGLRLQEAKRLLVETEFSVAEVSSRVGYSSVGTFSSRFKSCVGVSPSAFRALGGFASEPRPQDTASSTDTTPRVPVRLRGATDRAAGARTRTACCPHRPVPTADETR